MRIEIEREHRPIKAGWASHSPATRLTAHGRTEALADANLEHAIRLFLAPFQRAGTVGRELLGMGLRFEGEPNDTQVVLKPLS